MCFVDKPKPPKPAPTPRPAPVLDQTAPKFTDEKRDKTRSRSIGTKRYRAGGDLAIPVNSSASTGGLNIPSGG